MNHHHHPYSSRTRAKRSRGLILASLIVILGFTGCQPAVETLVPLVRPACPPIVFCTLVLVGVLASQAVTKAIPATADIP